MEFTEKERLELGSLSSEFNILVLIVSIFFISPIHNYGELIIIKTKVHFHRRLDHLIPLFCPIRDRQR